MLKSAEKFSSIASAINFKFLHIFYSFLSFSKFQKWFAQGSQVNNFDVALSLRIAQFRSPQIR